MTTPSSAATATTSWPGRRQRHLIGQNGAADYAAGGSAPTSAMPRTRLAARSDGARSGRCRRSVGRGRSGAARAGWQPRPGARTHRPRTGGRPWSRRRSWPKRATGGARRAIVRSSHDSTPGSTPGGVGCRPRPGVTSSRACPTMSPDTVAVADRPATTSSSTTSKRSRVEQRAADGAPPPGAPRRTRSALETAQPRPPLPVAVDAGQRCPQRLRSDPEPERAVGADLHRPSIPPVRPTRRSARLRGPSASPDNLPPIGPNP